MLLQSSWCTSRVKASGSSFGLGARRKKESKSQKQSEHTQGERFDGQLFEPPSLKMRQISLQNPMTDYFTRLDGKKAKKIQRLGSRTDYFTQLVSVIQRIWSLSWIILLVCFFGKRKKSRFRKTKRVK